MKALSGPRSIAIQCANAQVCTSALQIQRAELLRGRTDCTLFGATWCRDAALLQLFGGLGCRDT
jgi:hypothetical protein